MIIKKSALYGIIILSTATLPLSAQAADGNIVCHARTINSGDLFDIDLLGHAHQSSA